MFSPFSIAAETLRRAAGTTVLPRAFRSAFFSQLGMSRLEQNPATGVHAASRPRTQRITSMGIIWTIIIGFVAGVVAKLIMPGDNEPQGFVLTTILGIIGAVVATYLGQSLGWYGPGDGAGLIGAIVGAIVVLFIFGMVRKRA
jgi:uncharacterized membrane protein YeaQ/YmgE (transglycosylase-associated protein family)